MGRRLFSVFLNTNCANGGALRKIALQYGVLYINANQVYGSCSRFFFLNLFRGRFVRIETDTETNLSFRTPADRRTVVFIYLVLFTFPVDKNRARFSRTRSKFNWSMSRPLTNNARKFLLYSTWDTVFRACPILFEAKVDLEIYKIRSSFHFSSLSFRIHLVRLCVVVLLLLSKKKRPKQIIFFLLSTPLFCFKFC